MMSKTRSRSAAVVAMCLVMVGCANKDFVKPSIAQIDAYIQANPDLPEYDKACIYDGRFEVGIRQSTLEFLLGKPHKLDIVQQPWAVQERWIYKRRGQKVFVVEDKHVVGILEEE
jgi:hypothetical protein